METPDVPALLRDFKHQGCSIDFTDVTYYVGYESILRRKHGKGLPLWQEGLFAFLQRNSAHVGHFVNLPRDAVVEIGREVEI
jgi:KUP system potassium uptake protein